MPHALRGPERKAEQHGLADEGRGPRVAVLVLTQLPGLAQKGPEVAVLGVLHGHVHHTWDTT